MNILMLASDVDLKGGIQRYTRGQFSSLKKSEKVDSLYLFSLSNNVEGSFEETIPVSYCRKKNSLFNNILFILRTIYAVLVKKIDLVLINHINLAPLGLIIKILFRVPYITNVYGIEIWSGLNMLKRLSLKGSNSLIGDCNHIINYVRENGLYEGKIHLLYDPVDVNNFRALDRSLYEYLYDKYDLPRNGLYLITVGRLERDKGHESLIAKLSNHPEWSYLVVGDGSDRNNLEEVVRKKGMQNVYFLGRVSEDDLVPLYNLAAAVYLLSRMDTGEGEGLPLGLIEGSACAKPILFGGNDGSKESYSGSIEPNGILLESSKDITRELNQLKSRELRKKLGDNGRRFAVANFSLQKFGEQFRQICLNEGL